MLNARGSGKYLSRDWQSRRNAAVVDSTHLSEDEKEYLEISGSTGANPPSRFKIDSSPVDPTQQPRFNAIDTRNLPQMGGK